MIAAGPQAKPLRLASTAWSPFTNDPGKARFALDLVHTALGRVGITAETTIIDEGRLTPALLNGEFDGSAALWRDDAREKALIYSRPYLENRLILVGRSGTDVAAKSLADLTGKRLALVEGYAYGDKTKGPNGPTYVASASEEDSIQKLLNGGADYTLMDELVVEYLLKNHSAEARARLAFGSTPLIVRTLHFAVNRKLPDAQRIVDQFNAELLGMIADRSYHRLLQLEWISADVDGDGRPEYVARSDQPGPNPPDHSYKLFSEQTAADPSSGPRFYFGGKVYTSWSAVPDAHKVPRAGGTLNDGAQFSIFTFKF
jgi:polar amino acid transport system substrate-binding protein